MIQDKKTWPRTCSSASPELDTVSLPRHFFGLIVLRGNAHAINLYGALDVEKLSYTVSSSILKLEIVTGWASVHKDVIKEVSQE